MQITVDELLQLLGAAHAELFLVRRAAVSLEAELAAQHERAMDLATQVDELTED
jgi:hypothetical protein